MPELWEARTPEERQAALTELMMTNYRRQVSEGRARLAREAQDTEARRRYWARIRLDENGNCMCAACVEFRRNLDRGGLPSAEREQQIQEEIARDIPSSEPRMEQYYVVPDVDLAGNIVDTAGLARAMRMMRIETIPGTEAPGDARYTIGGMQWEIPKPVLSCRWCNSEDTVEELEDGPCCPKCK